MQTTLFDEGWVREHVPIVHRPDLWGVPWRIARTEAERTVRDFGQLPGTDHWCLRVLPYRADGNENGYTSSTGAYRVWTETRGVEKRLNADGTVTEAIIIYPKKHDPIEKTVASICIDGDDLIITADDSEIYAATIVDDEDPDTFRPCDIRDRTHFAAWDPAGNTEHLILAMIRAGIPRDEITDLHLTAYCPTMAAPPYVHEYDGKGGRTVIANPKAEVLGRICDRIGITLPYTYDVPALEAPVDIMPIHYCKYCARAKGCEERKNGGCLHGFLWNRKAVEKKHVYVPGKRKRSPREEEVEG